MSIRRASSAEQAAETAGAAVAPGRSLATPFGADDTAELLLDLLEHTALVAPDALALVRGRTVDGTPLTQALIDEGVATSDGVARMLAVRHHLPVVDLPAVGVAVNASQLIPVQTLERSVAMPYELDGDILRVAVADPGNLHAIDELRLATKHSLELVVGSRDDILAELQRASFEPQRRSVPSSPSISTSRLPTTPTTSKSTTASPTGHSSDSSTR
jgi:hypothetical protein